MLNDPEQMSPCLEKNSRFSIDPDLMCLRNTFHHSLLSQYLSLSPKICIAARKTQPAQASKPPLSLGHFRGTLTLYLEPESDCLIHIEGRTSLDNRKCQGERNCDRRWPWRMHGHTEEWRMNERVDIFEHGVLVLHATKIQLESSLDAGENKMNKSMWSREGRMDTCICMAESLHCSPETIITLLIGHTPKQKV